MDPESCRICLKPTQGGISININFFKRTVWECISEIGSISAVNDPKLPQEVCQKCFGTLGAAVQLKDKIVESDRTLKQLKLQGPKPRVTIEPIINPIQQQQPTSHESISESVSTPRREFVKEESPDWPSDVESIEPDWADPEEILNDTEMNEPEWPDLDNDEMQTEETEETEKVPWRVTYEDMPRKSREVYEAAYQKIVRWFEDNGLPIEAETFTEKNLLAFFEEKSKEWKSTTLWTKYSMMKMMVSHYHNVDIGGYRSIQQLIKKCGKGHKAKQSKVFTHHEIERFLREAPDEKYLMMKVATIICVFGACRRSELAYLTIDNVTEHKDSIIVKIPNKKMKKFRTFRIDGLHYIHYYKKYLALRPDEMDHRRLFVQYINGKCTRCPVGINSHGRIPSEIATFLNLPDPKAYTGNCFRRTSTTSLNIYPDGAKKK